jgi:glycosyltransferase involved in cell wall biosynthesis
VGVPIVYTPHCFGFAGEVGVGRRLGAIVAERALGGITDAVVCVCDAELELAVRHRIGGSDRRFRVYNGAEPCESSLDVPPALSAARARGPVVGTVAVFRRQKRIDVLLEAAPAVLAEVPDCSIAIVGDGPLRGEIEDRVRQLGLATEGRFHLLPFHGSSARYLGSFDVFALSSAWEALPISALEALACGVPQVATDVGGVREAVSRETGVLVPPGSPGLMARR